MNALTTESVEKPFEINWLKMIRELNSTDFLARVAVNYALGKLKRVKVS